MLIKEKLMFWKKKSIVELQPFLEFVEECRLKALCFTGHRSQKLPWRFNEKDPRCIEMRNNTKAEIEKAINDGYIYFMDVENNYQIHRYNPSTGEEQTLTYDCVENFNVYDNCIYYQQFSQTSPALMRMFTDGSNVEIIAYGNFENINLTSQYAYYTEYGSSTPLYHQSLWGPVNPSVFMPQPTK